MIEGIAVPPVGGKRAADSLAFKPPVGADVIGADLSGKVTPHATQAPVGCGVYVSLVQDLMAYLTVKAAEVSWQLCL